MFLSRCVSFFLRLSLPTCSYETFLICLQINTLPLFTLVSCGGAYQFLSFLSPLFLPCGPGSLRPICRTHLLLCRPWEWNTCWQRSASRRKANMACFHGNTRASARNFAPALGPGLRRQWLIIICITLCS